MWFRWEHSATGWSPVVYYRTAAEAECAAWRIKDKIEQAVMLRDGETLSSAKAVGIIYVSDDFC